MEHQQTMQNQIQVQHCSLIECLFKNSMQLKITNHANRQRLNSKWICPIDLGVKFH